MTILGIETSCDETALALIESRTTATGEFEYRVIQSLIHSQAELHSAYGGVFPALAKREHSRNLVPLLEKILSDLPNRDVGDTKHEILNPKLETNSNIQNIKNKTTPYSEKFELIKKTYGEQNADLVASLEHAHFLLEHIPNIDCIAVTAGPGLEPALWVGITFAKILGELWNIPVVPVNHMEGHVIGSLISNDKPYGSWQQMKELALPAVALLVSGGHTELVKITGEVPSKYRYSLLGQTRDDAVGEAFDKVARLLGLSYPGGPHVSKLAHEAWEQKIVSTVKLPRPMIGTDDLDFSFSGLKTAVLYAVQAADKNSSNTDDFKKGLAYEFEQSITDVLDTKLQKAIEHIGAQSVIVGGGVSANHVLRIRLAKTAEKYGIPLLLPSLHVAGDNALMIALVVAMKYSAGKIVQTHSGDIRAQGTQKITG